MSIILLSSGIWFGYELTTLIIGDKFDLLNRMSTGVSLGIAIQSLVFFVTTVFFPLTKVHCLTVALIFHAISIILNYFNCRRLRNRINQMYVIKFSVIELIIITPCVIFACWAAVVCNLRDNMWCRGPSFADLPFHMNIISSFSHGINYKRSSFFDVWSSFQEGIPLAYPMFHNLYVAAMINADDSLMYRSIQLTAFVLTLSSFVLLHSVFLEFSGDRFVAAISIPVWLTVGSIGWAFRFYNGLEFDPNMNWMNHLGEYNAFWLQPFAQIFLPQRSAAFTFPLVLTCLLCFFRISKLDNFPASYLVLAGCCTAILPQLQVHSFVALAQYSITLCLIRLKKENFKSYFWKWFMYGAISCVIGLPLTYPYWIRKKSGFSIMTFNPVWSERQLYGKLNFPLISLWWDGAGPFAYIMLLFGWVSASKWQLIHWSCAMVVWLTSSLIRYQPWALDNFKLLFAVWLPIAVPYVMQFYMYVYRKAKNSKIIKAIIFVLIATNSFSSFYNYMLETYRELFVMADAEYECGKWIMENTPMNATFMSFSSRFNPATSLAGRQLYSGFISWIAQHGIGDATRIDMQNKLLGNKGDVKMWQKEVVRYVLIKQKDPFVFTLSIRELVHWNLEFQFGPYTIYRLNENEEEEPNEEVPKEQRKKPKRTQRKRAPKRTPKKNNTKI